MSDTHVGLGAVDELDGVVDYVNTLDPPIDFVIHTGDIADDGRLLAQLTTAKGYLDTLTMPYYTTPGNHDQWYEGITNYDATFQARHYSIDAGDFVLIMFEGTINGMAGGVTAGELTWIEAQMIAAGTKPIILASHYPLVDPLTGYGYVDADGGAALKALCATYGVKAALGGHAHQNMMTGLSGSTKCVNGPAVEPTPSNFMPGGFVICNVFSNRIEMDYQSSVTFERYNIEPVIIYL